LSNPKRAPIVSPVKTERQNPSSLSGEAPEDADEVGPVDALLDGRGLCCRVGILSIHFASDGAMLAGREQLNREQTNAASARK
jgi:hypothetical protein